jgi:ketosteroid isomerase-like protein
MKNKILKGTLIGCIAILIFACNGNQAKMDSAAVDKEQIKKEIQAKEDAFAELYNKNELKNIGYYADDAVSYLQNRPPLVGRDSIVSFLKNDIISNTDKISFTTKEVFVSSDGNMVVEFGYFKVVDTFNNPLNTGNYMSYFEKRNGKYVAVRDMSASDK